MVYVPKLELQSLMTFLRFALTLLCGSFIFDLIDPALLILTSPNTVLYRVASLTHHREWVATAYMGCAILIAPYNFLLAFNRCHHRLRLFTKLALTGVTMSVILWGFMCFMGWRIEIGWTGPWFIRSTVGSVLFAVYLAVSLNSELKRAQCLEKRRKQSEQDVLFESTGSSSLKELSHVQPIQKSA